MLAALVSPLVGLAGETTAVPMGIVMVAAIGLAGVAFLVLPRRDGGMPQTPEDAPAHHREDAAVA